MEEKKASLEDLKQELTAQRELQEQIAQHQNLSQNPLPTPQEAQDMVKSNRSEYLERTFNSLTNEKNNEKNREENPHSELITQKGSKYSKPASAEKRDGLQSHNLDPEVKKIVDETETYREDQRKQQPKVCRIKWEADPKKLFDVQLQSSKALQKARERDNGNTVEIKSILRRQ